MEKKTAITFKLGESEKERFEKAAGLYMGGVTLSSFLRIAAHQLADSVKEPEVADDKA